MREWRMMRVAVRKHPWEQWFDGRVHTFTEGFDFPRGDAQKFIATARAAAHRRGLSLEVDTKFSKVFGKTRVDWMAKPFGEIREVKLDAKVLARLQWLRRELGQGTTLSDTVAYLLERAS